MLTAIIFILTIGVLFAIVFSMLTGTTQKTMDHYLLNQEEALARSALEYTLLAVGGNEVNDSSKCLNQINMNYQNTYDINVTIHYIGSGLPVPGCNVLDNSVQDVEDNATAIIDILVSLKPDVLPTNPPVTYFRRFIQKL